MLSHSVVAAARRGPDNLPFPLTPTTPDLQEMWQTVRRVLGDEAELFTSVEVVELCQRLRGDIAVLIPVVQDFGTDQAKASQAVTSARRQLDLPGPEPGRERLLLVRLATSAQLLLDLVTLQTDLGPKGWQRPLRGPTEERRCVAAALPANEHHAGQLRRMVRQTLRSWQLHDAVEEATLVAHELFTNAVTHGSAGHGDLITIELRHAAQELYVAVTDYAPDRVPELREAGDEDEHGRGLQLIESVCTNWDVERCHLTKTVWALLSTRRSSA
jgi:anti-sigma regulatory factor (Ser/Thr protein kinase)